jgi:hypothetical protein
LDYFTAVQEGKRRAQVALSILNDVAGPSNPVLFLKVGKQNWEPVGEENMYSVIFGKNETGAVVLCDNEGNAKALSAWLDRKAASDQAAKLEALGFQKYAGEVKLPI